MCISIETQLEVLSESMAELYFVKRDYIGLMSFLSDQISWIGTGKNEICSSKEEAMSFFEEEKKVYDGYFLIENAWYKGIEISEDSGVVMITMTIRTPEDASYFTEMPLRFSVFWKKERDLWKVVHVHNSVPDENLEDKNYFNLESAKSAYNQVAVQLNQATNTDTLTRINNVNGFLEDATKIFKNNPKQKYALVKFGIRNFRYVNKMHGYSVGDMILQNVAKNLRKSCRINETCARIEKDTFAMIYKFKDKTSMNQRMDRIRPTLLDKRIIKKTGVDINFNAGIYLPSNLQEKILDMLDKALIAQQSISKVSFGSQYVYFEDWMLDIQMEKSNLLENAIPAMKNGEFKLFIQPQFDVHTGKIVAGEALCRWVHNNKMIPPNEFIPVFEEYGIIINFDFHMLEILCMQMKEWIEHGLELKPISINQSRLHIENENYLETFCETVDRYQIPHDYIAFELTESTFVEQQEEMLKLAYELHKRGFQLAIDDFGTGYASLNFLSVVSADILKIDKCLLDGIEYNKRSRSIIEKTIELAHDIDMTVICEGIETEEQLGYLKSIGCDIGQGYLISKPIDSELFESCYLAKRDEEANDG